MKPSYGEQFGEFCANLKYDHLPQTVVERVKYCFIDYLAIALRASTLDSSQPIYQLINDLTLPGKATVIGRNQAINPYWAALANGTAAHSLELDDTYLEGSIHNEPFLYSSAVALAEENNYDGKKLIEAIVVGFDVACRVAKALKPAVTNARGFHPTGTCGVIGAAVACGKLLDLNAAQFTSAIGIACTQASGSLEYITEGAWTKRLNAGWASHAGLIAASLAKRNFTGPRTALEGKFGFLHAYSGDPILDGFVTDLGKDYKILQTAIKYYPCNYYIQSVNDATLQIVQNNNFKPEQIESIKIYTITAAYNIVCNPIEDKRNPKSMIDAQFSMPFNAAVAILKKQVKFTDLVPAVWEAPETHQLMNLTECIIDPELDKQYPEAWPARVEIKLKQSSQPLIAEIKYPKGDRRNPLSWDELIIKHQSIVEGLVDKQVDTQLIDFIRHLEQQPNFTKFSELLRSSFRENNG